VPAAPAKAATSAHTAPSLAIGTKDFSGFDSESNTPGSDGPPMSAYLGRKGRRRIYGVVAERDGKVIGCNFLGRRRIGWPE
jgi:hypothetical protein